MEVNMEHINTRFVLVRCFQRDTLLMFWNTLLTNVWSLYDIYWRTLKTQHLDNSFNLCLEKEARTIILSVC